MGLLKKIPGVLYLSFYLTLLGLGAEGEELKSVKLVSGDAEINLSQHQGWVPLVQTVVNLTEINGIKSTFLFRTFDPEGVVFYGDTLQGQDWFTLALKDGIPEMQIGKADILASMHGGPKLNDGKWHLMEISNHGDFVRLDVNHQKAVVLGLTSKMADVVQTGQIRLALGGILVSPDKLFVPFQPAMDGCIREGNWLNLGIPWEQKGETKPCYENIKPGSYFSGSGLAEFNTTALPGQHTEEPGITIDIYGDSTTLNGTILSLNTPGQELATMTLTVDNNLKRTTFKILPNDKLTISGKTFKRLSIILLKEKVILRTFDGNLDSTEVSTASKLVPDYASGWRNGRILSFGGPYRHGAPDHSPKYLTGCLEKIQVQGQDIDLDLAQYKHFTISSHSCPL
ncbi:hypothetical protein UPYG_G00241340 [Umbra pygmaea]|uniref:Sex hormone-binding globulin n=1 Tax=Umbra pygmaea TaxID=75934 RepID=A0ABD0X1K2_UMBPY